MTDSPNYTQRTSIANSLAIATLALFVTPMVALSVQSNDDDEFQWTGWRGADRTATVRGIDLPSPWPDQLELKWEVQVGAGYGTPIVNGPLVLQHGRIDENEMVTAIEFDTGNIVWQKGFAVPFQMGGGAERHGKGPKSCPVFSDGKFFTVSINGIVTAWDDQSGDIIWQRDFRSEFDVNHPYWGASTSPLVADEQLIVHLGTDGKGKLYALDVNSGDETWTSGAYGPAYASPFTAELHGKQQFIEWNEQVLSGIDISTGIPLWEYSFPQVTTDQNMPTPAFSEGVIFLGGENRGIQALRPHPVRPNLDGSSWEVEQLWHQEEVALDMSSAVINDGFLYGFSHYGLGRLFCLDVETGEIAWQGPPRSGENVAFLSTDRFIIALKNDGVLEVIEATPESYQPIVGYRVSDDRTWAPPVLTPQGFLVKDDSTLRFWAFP